MRKKEQEKENQEIKEFLKSLNLPPETIEKYAKQIRDINARAQKSNAEASSLSEPSKGFTYDQAAQKIVNDLFDSISSGELKRIPVTLEIKVRGSEKLADHISKCERSLSDNKISEIELMLEGFCQTIENIERRKHYKHREAASEIIKSLGLFREKGYVSHSFLHVESIDLRNEINPELIKAYQKSRKGELQADNRYHEYEIIEDLEMKEFGMLSTINKNFLLSDSYLERLLNERTREIPLESFWSVSELYPYWLPSLGPEKMKCQDLLEQVMITYTIKRAYLGDRSAIEALYGLFEKTAEGIAIMMSRHQGKKLRIDHDDIKSEARLLLMTLISGFSPSWYLQRLMKVEKLGYYQNWIAKYIVHYFTEVVYPSISKMPKDQLKELLCNKSIRKELETEGLTKLDIDNILSLAKDADPYAWKLNSLNPILALAKTDITEWCRNIEHYIDPKKTPYGRKVNSFVFRPNGRTNLYTWLFGVKKEPKKGTTKGFMQGKFPQLIKELLNKYTEQNKDSTHDFLDKGPENETGREHRERQKYNPDWRSGVAHVDDETIGKAVNKLMTDGISRRDAEIFLKYRLQHYTQIQLAKKYDLSRMQIYRICKKLSSKYHSF